MAVRAHHKPVPAKLTYKDYVSLPEDGLRYEILDGLLTVTPSPRTKHQLVSANLEFALMTWVRAKKLGRVWHAPLDLILADTTIVVPDIVYVSKGRSAIVSERGLEAAPDLVIEILSRSTTQRDRGIKMHLYARHGVPRFWIVDASRHTLEIYALRDNEYERLAKYREADIVRTDVPAGFEVPLRELWSDE